MEKPKILVIDDDPDFVEGIRIALEANDYEAYIAENGTEGLKLIKKIRPDLIILDVMMDTLTEGFHVSYQLRGRDPQSEYTAYSNIPILMLTAISRKMRIQFSLQADEDYLPVDEFVEKPFRLEALLEKVKKLLQRKNETPH
jgi:CheY-like chemotaxis protein